MKSIVLKYYKNIIIYNIKSNAKKEGRMNYKRIALQLFNELSDIYAYDICKHIDLCRRYPIIANEWEQEIMAYINSIEKPENYNKKEAKEQRSKLYERITDNSL